MPRTRLVGLATIEFRRKGLYATGVDQPSSKLRHSKKSVQFGPLHKAVGAHNAKPDSPQGMPFEFVSNAMREQWLLPSHVIF